MDAISRNAALCYSRVMEARLLLSICGLVLCLAALAGSLAIARRPGGRRPFLALVFLEVALYFLGELLTAALGRTSLALVLDFGSALYSLPSLYFYVAESTGERKGGVLRHYIPALVNAVIGSAIALHAAANGYREGWPVAVYLVLVEVGQTAQLVLYGMAAFRLARDREREGASPWPKRIILAALAGYGGFLALSWAGFGFSLASELLDRAVPLPEGFGTSSLVLTVLLAWTIGLCAIWGRDYAEARKAEGPKYGGRPLAEREAEAIVRRLRTLLAAEGDLASPAVEPRRLAARLGEPYYLLSRAVNERTGMSVSDLVNECRLERATRLLLERPGEAILDLALEAGFQAKSTFNDVFRKRMGMSPSEYRLRNGAAPGAAAGTAQRCGKSGA